ncbi:hypothetical protein PP1_023780 [Pseudonocardia sp. P1]
MRGLGPHLSGSLVLTPHLVVVVVSRGGVAARVATRSALDGSAAAWTLVWTGTMTCSRPCLAWTWRHLVRRPNSGLDAGLSLERVAMAQAGFRTGRS